jgi:Tol biopolymer transport system component
MANLDGSDNVQMTEDGATKSWLQWSPEGDALTYISGKCVYTLSLESGRIDIIVCFNYVDYLKSFEVSPDGSQVAISLDNQLYILPYDLEQLGALQRRSELSAMATCEEFAPYERNFVKMASWSRDGSSLAMVIFGVASGIGSADIIQVISMETCTAQPEIIDNFPPPRFRMPAYERSPAILNFGWDGLSLFVFNTLVRNNGYGDLYVYNMDLHKARMELNPINDSCCYRDAIWSPDGNYLLFAYQDYSAGADALVLFYYIPYGTIGTGVSYEPMPLPGFADLKASPLPVLRPAQ